MNFKQNIIFLIVYNIVGDGVFYLLSNQTLPFSHLLLQGFIGSILAIFFIELIKKYFTTTK